MFSWKYGAPYRSRVRSTIPRSGTRRQQSQNGMRALVYSIILSIFTRSFVQGTPCTMPVEISNGAVINWAASRTDRSKTSPLVHPLHRRADEDDDPITWTTIPIGKQTLAHHYLHDMESLWWTAILFYFRLPCLPSRLEGVQLSMAELFPRDGLLTVPRYHFLAEDTAFSMHIKKVKLADDNHPLQKAVDRLAACLNGARETLVEGYQTLNALPDFPCECIELYNHCSWVASALHSARQAARRITKHLDESKSDHWAIPYSPHKRALESEQDSEAPRTKQARVEEELTVSHSDATSESPKPKGKTRSSNKGAKGIHSDSIPSRQKIVSTSSRVTRLPVRAQQDIETS